MVAATTVIPFVAERRMKGQVSLEGLANGEVFDKAKTDELWEKVKTQFKELYCKVHNLRQGSSLTKCLEAMAYSLPEYSKAQKKMKEMNRLVANTREMPCEVCLGPDFAFHNTFICPVSKEANDCPMLLKCGHVVSK